MITKEHIDIPIYYLKFLHGLFPGLEVNYGFHFSYLVSVESFYLCQATALHQSRDAGPVQGQDNRAFSFCSEMRIRIAQI